MSVAPVLLCSFVMPRAESIQPANKSTCSVLLAEDEEHTRRTLSLILRKAGYLVTAVGDGREALQRFCEHIEDRQPIGLLVIDIQMPGMTGLDLMAEMDKRGVSLPTIVISGYQYKRIIEGYQATERVAYLEKPFTPDEFLACLNSVIGRRSSNPHHMKEKTTPC